MPEVTQSDIDRFKRGENFDWHGKTVNGDDLSTAISEAIKSGIPTTFFITNAVVNGDVDLSGVDGAKQTFFMENCNLRGQFNSPNSNWKSLSILNCNLNAIDFDKSHFTHELRIEHIRCSGEISIQECEIGKQLTLSESLASGSHTNYAIDLTETRVGGSCDATHLKTASAIVAKQLRVDGDLILDGAQFSSPTSGSVAADFSYATVKGEMRLCATSNKAFRCEGILVLRSVTAQAIVLHGAVLDGKGNPSLVGDQLVVYDSVSIASARTNKGKPFEATGTVRLIAARIGSQLQIIDAKFRDPTNASLILDSAKIGTDALLGIENQRIDAFGEISVRSVTVGGRLLVHAQLNCGAKKTALSLRESSVSGEVALYDTNSIGGVELFLLRARRVGIDNLRITRATPVVKDETVPDAYAHPDDALLDLGYAQIETDLHVDKLEITGGDLRFLNAKFGGGIQIARFKISSKEHAIIGQSATVARELHLAGTVQTPSLIEGSLNLMGIKIEGDLSIVDVIIGSSAARTQFYIRGCNVGGITNLARVKVHGRFDASAAIFSSDLVLQGTQLLAPKDKAWDLRHTRVNGLFQIAEIQNSTEAKLDGILVADGAFFGSLEWRSLTLASDAQLLITNASIQGKLFAGPILAEAGGTIDLSGTAAAELADRIDNEIDSWGAGKISLRLNGFRYERLSDPSGRNSESPSDVRRWRAKWLARSMEFGSGRPARHLAHVLRNAGMFEASRLVLIDAFAIEGRSSPNFLYRALQRVWGFAFGFGLSGGRAVATVCSLWILGIVGTIDLQNKGLLVTDISYDGSGELCTYSIDPIVYAADVMIPVLDLGEEKLCRVGLSSFAEPEPVLNAIEIGKFSYRLSEWNIWRIVTAIYAVVGWVVLSLAVATWSGLFRRSGRE